MKYTKRRLNDFNIQGYPPAQHRLLAAPRQWRLVVALVSYGGERRLQLHERAQDVLAKQVAEISMVLGLIFIAIIRLQSPSMPRCGPPAGQLLLTIA